MFADEAASAQLLFSVAMLPVSMERLDGSGSDSSSSDDGAKNEEGEDEALMLR